MIAMVYSGMALVRRREMGVLLALGLRPFWVTLVLLAEALVCAIIGSLSGMVLGFAAIKFFQRTLVFFWEMDGVPFAMPDSVVSLIVATICFVVCLITASAGILLPLTRCKYGEPWLLMRGTEE
jgi:ABC-type lipoprotein release transport system permease subunit